MKEVIERLEGATGPNDALNREVCIATGIAPRIEAPFDAAGRGVEIYPPVMWSIDAALAFVERVLPGVMWRIGFDPDYGVMKAELVTAAPNCINKSARHEKVPLAILIAALKALQERGGRGVTDTL